MAIIALARDCYPYGSHTTASDTLWAGMPLVALKDDDFVSRVSVGVLTAAGWPDRDGADAYFELVFGLARDTGGARGSRRASRSSACARPRDADGAMSPRESSVLAAGALGGAASPNASVATRRSSDCTVRRPVGYTTKGL